jgi:hypothetical protein
METMSDSDTVAGAILVATLLKEGKLQLPATGPAWSTLAAATLDCAKAISAERNRRKPGSHFAGVHGPND